MNRTFKSSDKDFITNHSLTVSLKNEFIEYINNKNFKCVNYGDNNTWITNKNNLEKYLIICNFLGIIDKLRDVIDDNLDPMEIIYTKLCNSINDRLPEIIDDTFHVSKISECLAVNTKEGYYDITINNNATDNANNNATNYTNNNAINTTNNNEINNTISNNVNISNDNIKCNQLLLNFKNENNIMNDKLSKDMINSIKESDLFVINDITNKEDNEILTKDDINRKILAIKTNIMSLKHDNKLYSIYYGHLFESLMVDIMKDVIFVNNSDDNNNNNNINNNSNNNINNNNNVVDNNKDKIITNFINNHEIYLSDDFDNAVNELDKAIDELEKENNDEKIENKASVIIQYNDIVSKLAIKTNIEDNKIDYCGRYLRNGLTSIIDELIKHDNLTTGNLLELYKFTKELTNEFHDQELGLVDYIELFKYYIQFILLNQLKELILTYIPNTYKGKVIKIIPKPIFNYGFIHGEGDFIIVVKKTKDNNKVDDKNNSKQQNNKQQDNNDKNNKITNNKTFIMSNINDKQQDNDLIYILADSKCYTSIKENEILKFAYQLIGYNQLHEHNKIIPSYRRQHNYSFSSFMIINPLNEINRTLTYYYVNLNDYSNDVDILADNFERYLEKCIDYIENIKKTIMSD